MLTCLRSAALLFLLCCPVLSHCRLDSVSLLQDRDKCAYIGAGLRGKNCKPRISTKLWLRRSSISCRPSATLVLVQLVSKGNLRTPTRHPGTRYQVIYMYVGVTRVHARVTLSSQQQLGCTYVFEFYDIFRYEPARPVYCIALYWSLVPELWYTRYQAQ